MLPIIVAAYNRPTSLERLLRSLAAAHFPEDERVDLYISVDFTEADVCDDVIRKFKWNFGEKNVIKHPSHLGLVKHIKSCGDLAAKLGQAIVLEDDLFVSPAFYDYANKSLAFYHQEPEIAGISLYAYSVAETDFKPFAPIDTGGDTYFMQVASSWGQLWTSEQWQQFTDWWEEHPTFEPTIDIPSHLFHWGAHSWKRFFNWYLVEKQKFFVYPKASYSTNFEDEGTNATTRGLFQVPLQLHKKESFLFESFQSSKLKYDAWFEPLPEAILGLDNVLVDQEVIIDFRNTKKLTGSGTHLWLTSKDCISPIKTWSNQLVPSHLNVVLNNQGSGISLAHERQLIANAAASQSDLGNHHILVLVALIEFTKEKLDRTIDSLSKQSFKNFKLVFLVPQGFDENLLPGSNLDYAIIPSLPNEIDAMLEQAMKHLTSGTVLPAKVESLIDQKWVESATQAFNQVKDLDLLVRVKPDKKGFIAVYEKYAALKSVSAFAKSTEFACLDRVAFKVEWFKKRANFAHTENMMVGSNSKVMFMEDTALLNDLGKPSIKVSLWVRMWILVASKTRSIFPHEYLSSLLRLPDTLRFDSIHKTWYRSRF